MKLVFCIMCFITMANSIYASDSVCDSAINSAVSVSARFSYPNNCINPIVGDTYILVDIDKLYKDTCSNKKFANVIVRDKIGACQIKSSDTISIFIGDFVEDLYKSNLSKRYYIEIMSTNFGYLCIRAISVKNDKVFVLANCIDKCRYRFNKNYKGRYISVLKFNKFVKRRLKSK